MRPDWDADSPQLRHNLTRVLQTAETESHARAPLNLDTARRWQRGIIQDLAVPDPAYVGKFRGEPGLERCQVRVGWRWGVPAAEVSNALLEFEQRMQQAIALLDSLIPADAFPNADQTNAVIELCAWVHAEWVRIHPFANGNGRTARLWVNSIAMRYALPPFLRLRPRPQGDYAATCAQAMLGNWTPTVDCLLQLLNDAS
jgi:fido (protein-threonine AMPylation protein)